MVILDISMPRLQGLEAIKIIKGLYPAIKVLILTMHKSKDYLIRPWIKARMDIYSRRTPMRPSILP